MIHGNGIDGQFNVMASEEACPYYHSREGHEMKLALEELMEKFRKYRDLWIKENGTVDGFNDWFTDQVLNRKADRSEMPAEIREKQWNCRADLKAKNCDRVEYRFSVVDLTGAEYVLFAGVSDFGTEGYFLGVENNMGNPFDPRHSSLYTRVFIQVPELTLEVIRNARSMISENDSMTIKEYFGKDEE